MQFGFKNYFKNCRFIKYFFAMKKLEKKKTKK